MQNAALIRLLAALSVVCPAVAQACGELRFNAGKGLPFQSYIAPRPADVLIVYSDALQDDYLAALEQAGHRLKIVANPAAVAEALREQHYDIVIAAYDSVDAVTPQVASVLEMPSVLPIVARSMRKDPQVTGRFEQILLDSASLGQYLTAINKLVNRLP